MWKSRGGWILFSTLVLLLALLVVTLGLQGRLAFLSQALESAPWRSQTEAQPTAIPLDPRVPADWPRYSDRGLGLTWSLPGGWKSFVVQDETSRMLVFQAEGSSAVLFLTSVSDPEIVAGWDPLSATTEVAGQPAQYAELEGGQNPPMKLVAFRLDERLLTVALSYRDEADAAPFDTIVASLAPVADERYVRAYDVVTALSSNWNPCGTACGQSLKARDARWCDLLVSAGDWGGVNVYHNGSSYGNACYDYYGLTFQCVELVQRFYWEKRGHDTSTNTPRWNIASAYQAWNTHPKSLEQRANGSGHTPVWGDILVWKPVGVYYPHGHVAVITGVSNGRVYFVQQNAGSNGRGSLEWRDGRIQDDRVYGWLHYTGGQQDTTRPDGDITMPAKYAATTTGRLRLEGWARDSGSGLKMARFYALYGGRTVQIGPDFTKSPFSYEWDLKAAGVPDGQITIALDIWDNAGNVAYTPRGVHYVTKITPLALPRRAVVPLLGRNLSFAQARALEGVVVSGELPTPEPTPTPLPPGACTQLLQNGDLETHRGWQFSGEVPGELDTTLVHGGQQALRLGSPDAAAAGKSIAEQWVDVPLYLGPMRLSLWYWATAGATEADYHTIAVVDEEGKAYTLRVLVNVEADTRAWRELVIEDADLRRFAGQTVRLRLLTVSDGTGSPAMLYVDDLAWERCP